MRHRLRQDLNRADDGAGEHDDHPEADGDASSLGTLAPAADHIGDGRVGDVDGSCLALQAVGEILFEGVQIVHQ